MRSARISHALLVSLACACSGGGDKGPTAPAAAQVSLLGALTLFAVPLDPNAVIAPVIIEAHLLLDGQTVDRQTHSPPKGIVTFTFGDVQITPGNHTIAIRIVRHTLTSQQYDFSGFVRVNKLGAEKSFTIPKTEKQLRAGESVEYRFDATL